eukprot:9081803-Pyramimonas_sp.AAC.1
MFRSKRGCTTGTLAEFRQEALCQHNTGTTYKTESLYWPTHPLCAIAQCGSHMGRLPSINWFEMLAPTPICFIATAPVGDPPQQVHHHPEPSR